VSVVGGGGIFTSWRQVLRRLDLRFSCFSRIVFGPGEGPLAALAAGQVPVGDYFLEGAGEVGFFPDYGFARFADYLSPVPVLPVSASRGCYWHRCLFCPEASSPTHPYAALPPASFPSCWGSWPAARARHSISPTTPAGCCPASSGRSGGRRGSPGTASCALRRRCRS
jgi:hypothetical protein